MKDSVELIGFIAGILTTSGYIPQIYTTFKTKDTKGLSSLFLLIMGLGISLWLLYGIFINSYSIIFANAFSLMCIITLCILKALYR